MGVRTVYVVQNNSPKLVPSCRGQLLRESAAVDNKGVLFNRGRLGATTYGTRAQARAAIRRSLKHWTCYAAADYAIIPVQVDVDA